MNHQKWYNLLGITEEERLKHNLSVHLDITGMNVFKPV
jgi:hypothetical protein